MDDDSLVKTFVVDTSILIHDPSAIDSFGKNNVVLDISVIKELDGIKRAPNGRGASAREASRRLEEYRQLGALKEGVATKGGGILKVEIAPDRVGDPSSLPLEPTNDNRTIRLAYRLMQEGKSGVVVIVSKDMNQRLTADACGIPAEDWKHDKTLHSLGDLYSGTERIFLDTKANDLIAAAYNSKGEIDADAILALVKEPPKLEPNTCCYLSYQGPDGRLFTKPAIFKRNSKRGKTFRLLLKENAYKKSGVEPINAEQLFAYALLTDPTVSLITLVGKAGTGKTLISLLAGFQQVPDRFRQMVIYRPSIEIGQPLGFRPGTLEEKFQPWTYPILDNLGMIIQEPRRSEPGKKRRKTGNSQAVRSSPDQPQVSEAIQDYMDDQLIDIQPISFLRGRTLPNRFIIIDEAQNLTPHEVKTVVTRLGKNSKIVLTGDPEQIDNSFLDALSNGLSHTVERFKGQELFGHITMQKTERSPLAELASTLL